MLHAFGLLSSERVSQFKIPAMDMYLLDVASSSSRSPRFLDFGGKGKDEETETETETVGWSCLARCNQEIEARKSREQKGVPLLRIRCLFMRVSCI